MRRLSLLVILAWGWSPAPAPAAPGPADGLLKLVPPDAGLTLAVEDLRGLAREVGGSPLFQKLLKLDSARAWLASEPARKFQRAGRDLEAGLGLPLGVIRDEILGDAVVLTLRPGPEGRPDQARGLLLARPRDRSLVEPLLRRLNDAQLRSGELAGVARKERGDVKYSVRTFKDGGRPTEYYVLLDDGPFAWSNSEEMLLGVIGRKVEGGPGLGDDPAFAKVRRGLPERAVASLFVGPRLMERVIAEAPRAGPDRGAAMLARYLGAVGYAGVALQWRDGLVLHSHEALIPEKLDPWLRRWLARPRSASPLPGLVPATALAVASAHVDFEAARDALLDLVPEDGRPSLENLRLVLQGLLLGLDPNTAVLPRLGPGAMVYVEVAGPESGTRFPISPVGVVGWSDHPGADELAAPLDNAMRTALALAALDPKRRAARLRVEDRTVGGARLTVLTDGLRPLLAYRVDRNRLVVGTSPEAVARFGSGRPSATLAAVRAKSFPEAETFAVVDLERLTAEVRNLRGPIARRLAARSRRPVDATDRDLGQLIALADLFRAAAFTSAASPDGSEVHRTIGLIAR